MEEVSGRHGAAAVSGLLGRSVVETLSQVPPGLTEDAVRTVAVARSARVLLSSLDLAATLDNVIGVMARFFDCWCAVTTVDDEGRLHWRAPVGAQPAGDEVSPSLMAELPGGDRLESRLRGVLDGGRTEVVQVAEEDMAPVAPGHQPVSPLRRTGPLSALVVPLIAGPRPLGAVTLMRDDSHGHFDAGEIAAAEELAALSAQAIENATVHGRLRQDHERACALFDNLGAIVWEADPATLRFTFVNRRAEEVLGYPVQRWIEEPDFWASTIHPSDRDYTVSYRRVATAEGRDQELEYRMVAADRRRVWFQDIASVETGDDGQPRRLFGVMVDITRRKRAENVLWESRERFASLARTLQASLLPPHLPDIPELEVAARYRSAEDGVEVVGDFYDVFDVGGNDWGVVMGDVCGKGPEAAALTAVARHTVRAAAMRERRPSGVLAQLNEAVLNHDSEERFCTAVYARVVPGPEKVALSLSCGGHPLPLVLRADGTVETAGRPGTLLGLFEDPDLSDVDVELDAGDAAILFTDGATEAKRNGHLLGEDRLRAIVGTCAGLRAEEIAHRMEDAILEFQERSPRDDLAIVVLRVPEPSGA